MFVLFEPETGLIRETRTPHLGVVPEGLQWLETSERIAPNAYRVIAGELVPWAPSAHPEAVRRAVLAELAAVRYAHETGGVLIDGTRILTDRDDQAMTLSAFTTLREGFAPSVDWKGANGWVRLTLAELAPVAQAVAQHVQRSFSAERQVAEQIAALTDADLASFDVRAAFAVALENL